MERFVIDVLPLLSASGIAFLSLIPDNPETDLAKLGLGGALAIVCLASMWLGHKEKMAFAESIKTLAMEQGKNSEQISHLTERISVLTERLEHKPCLLHGK